MYLGRPYLVSKVTSSQRTRAAAGLQNYCQRMALLYNLESQGKSRTCRPENPDRVAVCTFWEDERAIGFDCYLGRVLSAVLASHLNVGRACPASAIPTSVGVIVQLLSQ